MTTRGAHIETALGRVRLVTAADALTGLYFEGHRPMPPGLDLGVDVDASADPVLARAAVELDEYLAGSRRSFDVPLATAGDEFSERVWALLRGIPYGETTTYGALARELGNARLAQRVGQCVGRNPLCILIPCHRVVGADGSLTGYAGGLERKRALLDLEEPPIEASDRLF